MDPCARRRQIAYRLVASQITTLRSEGFAYRIGRTVVSATAMRALFATLGFEELPERDAVFPERTYWPMPAGCHCAPPDAEPAAGWLVRYMSHEACRITYG